MAMVRRQRRTTDIWPGFVDALATLLIIIIFLLMIFVLAQFFLGQALSGKDESLNRLGSQLAELTDLLELERQTNAELRLSVSSLSSQLSSASAKVDALTRRADAAEEDLAAAKATIDEKSAELVALQNDIAALQAYRDELMAKAHELEAALAAEQDKFAKQSEVSTQARAEVALLNQQIAELKKEMARLNAALNASEALTKEQEAQIVALGERLNQALVSKVEELSRYRSEFFGRLREVLSKAEGIRIEGDRFVFQSEVLFAAGAADLGEKGQARIKGLAIVLKDLIAKIPTDINWVLRVDGHTDRRPIKTKQFPSNWELSTARAVSVVQQLIKEGIPADRLAAAGFAEFQPVDPAKTPQAYAKNRRIELKIDQR